MTNLTPSDTLTEVNGKMGFNPTGREDQSLTPMVLKQMKSLELGCVVLLHIQSRSLTSALDDTPHYSSQNCMPSTHAQ
jgi:hypothetical protein